MAANLNVDMAKVRGSGPDGEVRYVDVLRAPASAQLPQTLPAEPPPVSEAVRQVAAHLGVDLAGVRGSGAGGEILCRDVYRAKAAARQAQKPPAAAPKAAPPPTPTPAPAAAVRPLLHVDASRNPLVAAALAGPGGKQLAAYASTTPPTLFSTGDLPPFTASGMAPSALLSVPWFARHAVAAEKSPEKAAEMLEAFSGPDGDVAARVDNRVVNHEANYDYRLRVEQWQMAAAQAVGLAEWEREYSHHKQRAAAAAKPVNEMTEDELFDAVFSSTVRGLGKR
ncbi:E3 binding domain-containing protein [Streptosporangium pseudovulgare]|uniref:E3 binding domain-containing protein n=1 Tax=Streptosporangium pseudovulgare TaxID=35765 RepID=UPI001E43D7D5|nr:E3 binding domain-containing protein [Streptosporangium pseudovulgare]